MMYTLFVLLAFVSSLLSSIFGFGSAMIVLAIGPYFLPGHDVVALSAVLFAASTLTKTIAFRAHLHWPLVITITLGSLPFAYVGGLMLPLLSQEVLQRCLGILILTHVLLTQTKLRLLRRLQSLRGTHLQTDTGTDTDTDTDTAQVSTTVQMQQPIQQSAPQPGKIYLIAIAACYGFTSGLVGSGSVIKALFFRRLELSKEAFVGTMAATSVVATIGKIGAYTQTGLLHSGLRTPMLALIIVAITAVLIGRVTLRKIDSAVFTHGVTVLLIVAGIGLLF
jgi:uncharacterized membrane protein YfcA